MSSSQIPFDKLQKAAQLRRGGASWSEIALVVGRNRQTVRNWSTEHSQEWQAAIDALEKSESLETNIENAAREAILILRSLLRSQDEKIQRDAAKTLLDLNTSHSSPSHSKLAILAQMVEGLNDHDLFQLLQESNPAGKSKPDPCDGGES